MLILELVNKAWYTRCVCVCSTAAVVEVNNVFPLDLFPLALCLEIRTTELDVLWNN